MKFEEVLPALREGKKVRRKSWAARDYIVGGSSYELSACSLMADDWEVYEEPKKPRLLAPAFVKWEKSDHPELTAELYESEEVARKEVGKYFVSWPAVANKDGFYEVPS